MSGINLAEAKARLSELVERAERGEIVEIARRGRIVAKLVQAEPPRRAIDHDALDQLRASGPMTTVTVEEMRRLDLL